MRGTGDARGAREGMMIGTLGKSRERVHSSTRVERVSSVNLGLAVRGALGYRRLNGYKWCQSSTLSICCVDPAYMPVPRTRANPMVPTLAATPPSDMVSTTVPVFTKYATSNA